MDTGQWTVGCCCGQIELAAYTKLTHSESSRVDASTHLSRSRSTLKSSHSTPHRLATLSQVSLRAAVRVAGVSAACNT